MGHSRHEFLYDLRFWEIREIIKGYNCRHRHGWEQARLIAYHVRYCMGIKQGEIAPTLSDWLRFPWEREDVEASDQPTPEEVDKLRELMRQENARLHHL